MERFVVRASRRKLALLILASAAFLVLGLWMALAAPESRRFSSATTRIVGAASALLGIAGLVGLGRRAAGPAERIVIDERGVEDRDLRVGVIPWSAIAGAYGASVQKQEMVCLELRDPAAWVAKLPVWRRVTAGMNERMGLTPFVLSFSAADRDASEALAVIRDEIERRARVAST